MTSLSTPAGEAAPRPGITKDLFGTLSDGTKVWRYTLTSGVLRVRIITYGGIVQSSRRRTGVATRPTSSSASPTWPATSARTRPVLRRVIGRYANRIAKGTFTLDGRTYHLPINNDPNSLHGGTKGFDNQGLDHHARARPAAGSALRLDYTSPDGDEGTRAR